LPSSPRISPAKPYWRPSDGAFKSFHLYAHDDLARLKLVEHAFALPFH